ncbi:hypothetical protein CDD83_4729 [Cordyceps sp. RAO-2017]|nr:hypothetical protein CDD83_4729 [Cordyceps sp. RAO-2017]
MLSRAALRTGPVRRAFVSRTAAAAPAVRSSSQSLQRAVCRATLPLSSDAHSRSSYRSDKRKFSSSTPIANDQQQQQLAQEEDDGMTAAERSIADLLAAKLEPTHVLVQDVSGGCGTMYAIQITSPLFRGQSLLKQQRMVNATLGDIVKSWHGVQIRTLVPPGNGS